MALNRLPAMEIRGLNLPGIMQAQQQYKLGQAQLAEYGRTAEKEETMTGLRAGAVAGDKSMLDQIAAIDPAEAKRLSEWVESRDEGQREGFMRDAQMVYRAIADLGEDPSPLQLQDAMRGLEEAGVSAENLPFTPEQIQAVMSQPGELDRMKAQLGATAEMLSKRRRGMETEPRETRQIMRAGRPVGQEWSPTSGQWEDTQDMPVKLGVQAGELSGLTPMEPIEELPIEGVSEGTDVSMATGAGGALRNFVNTATDAFGWGMASPDNEKATRLLKRLSTETNLVMAGASVDGRVSNYVRERLRELEPSANKITQGDERTRQTISELVVSLSQRYNAMVRMLNNPKGYNDKDVSRAKASYTPLKDLIDQYRVLLDNWGGKPAPADTGLEEMSTEDLKKQLGIE